MELEKMGHDPMYGTFLHIACPRFIDEFAAVRINHSADDDCDNHTSFYRPAGGLGRDRVKVAGTKMRSSRRAVCLGIISFSLGTCLWGSETRQASRPLRRLPEHLGDVGKSITLRCSNEKEISSATRLQSSRRFRDGTRPNRCDSRCARDRTCQSGFRHRRSKAPRPTIGKPGCHMS